MTVHRAKNRQFDYTFVVWPFSVPASEEMRRRLLYNAVTRAKNDAMIIIEGDDERLSGCSALSLLA